MVIKELSGKYSLISKEYTLLHLRLIQGKHMWNKKSTASNKNNSGFSQDDGEYLLRLASIAHKRMSERKEKQDSVSNKGWKGKCWTHVGELFFICCFATSWSQGEYFLNRAGSQWEAEVSNK